MSSQIDIIFCYRDREAARVKASLTSLESQSDANFHVTFIDYGSNPENSSAVEAICKTFSFCSYFYINATGKMWNRGDALNQGILLSRSEHLFFSDIDMLFFPDFVELLHRLKSNNKANFFPVGYLSPRSTRKASKGLKGLPFKKSEAHASGMLLAPRQMLQKINGYNTFYSLWGLEDNDLRNRIVLNGFETSQVQEVYLLHQYHTPVPEDQSLPEGWIQYMKDHFQAQQLEKNNPSGITESLTVMGRPALQLVRTPGLSYREIRARKLFLRHLLLEALSQKSAQALRILSILPEKKGLIQKYSQQISSILKRTGLHVELSSPYQSQYITKKEILSEIYFLIKSAGPAILDYYIEEKDNYVQFIFVPR